MEMDMTTMQTGYIVVLRTTPTPMIYCTNGEFYIQRFIGPGGWCAKVYKTKAGAERAVARLGRGAVEVL